ncbi:hypothetical protein EJ05DRAFT_537314 [Pseudovirgaria hyperparasitica]|uniref:Uncharacterized protein n=1 Tax=Pseudovirgaria hyperparasitica TaxID=470096 RepID=A0A6A6W8Q4_9PEZI|nr:uncharacterized protein EJ05DRAFT_537314 [Pseudovirgaria hyperparasitica]KAF2758935.1 hypothetical protein EJ05DRAFT_537314 [Pseudovirgaria hyperparasitica]
MSSNNAALRSPSPPLTLSRTPSLLLPNLQALPVDQSESELYQHGTPPPPPPPPLFFLSPKGSESVQWYPAPAYGVHPPSHAVWSHRSGPSKSAESPTAGKIAKILIQWDEVKLLREEVLKERVREGQYLESMARLRRHAQDARADLMKMLNAAAAQGNFEACSKALKEVSERVMRAEEALNLLEQERAEFSKINFGLHDRLYEKDMVLQNYLDSMHRDQSSVPVPHSDDSTAFSSESGFVMPTESLLVQLYECTAEYKVIKARIDQLRDDHEVNLEFRRRHETAGQMLQISDGAFFDEFFTKYSTLRRELHRLWKKIRRIQSLCDQKAFVSLAESVSELSAATSSVPSDDGEIVLADDLIDEKRQVEEQYPGLFLKPGDKILSNFRGKTDRINRWLMHVFRLSSIEIWRHRSRTSLPDLPLETDEAWSSKVWSTWSIANSSAESIASVTTQMSESITRPHASISSLRIPLLWVIFYLAKSCMSGIPTLFERVYQSFY